MFKILWKSLLASPAVLLAALAVSSGANAAESTTKAEFNLNAISEIEVSQGAIASEGASKTEFDFNAIAGDELAQAVPDATSEQLDNYSNEGQSNTETQDQVTSVNELRDVQPTEWAYEALRSLVERYGCIVGYPDQTYRGNRALTRWEFAAGLNACMNTLERLIQENVAVLKEDIDTLKRLMQEFEAELAALGARVDNLEGRVSFLEDHQFSTTTKLTGEVIFAVTDSFGDEDDSQTVFGDRVRLTLNTSFFGNDRLITRLAAGNLEAFDVDGDGVTDPTATQTFNLKVDDGNDIFVDWLAYYYPLELGEDITINSYLAATGGIWSDIAPTSNPFFEDFDGGNGALSTFASENPIFRIGGGSGLALNTNVGPVQVTAGYLAGNAANPDEGSGLFNGDYAALGQLNFSPTDEIELGATFVHAYHKAGNPIFGFGSSIPGDDGEGVGVVGTNTVNTFNDDFDRLTTNFGLQASWRIADLVSISAFGSYGEIFARGGTDSEYWTYGGGVAVPDLGKEGSVLGLFGGVQPYLGDNLSKNPIHVELFYKYQLNDNISITPGVIWISNPEQTDDSDDAFVGTVRTTFTF
jgi:Carbohydrate-selective porin, OprB family/S-layer homology domain